MAAAATPSEKEIVRALMPLLRVEPRDVHEKNGLRRDVLHNIFQCPKKELCVVPGGSKGEYACQQSAGYRNAYRHLLKCYAGSDPSYLLSKYQEKRATAQSEIGDFLPSSITSGADVNTREKAMHDYIRFAVEACVPIRTFEKNSFQSVSKYPYKFSCKTIREVMLKTVEIVEKTIGEEMRKTKGAIMYDRWSHSGTHYVGIFAVYMCSVPNLGSQSSRSKDELRVVLISLSPMAATKNDGDGMEDNNEATMFDAETHVAHMKDVFEIFGIEFEKWVVCQIADDASVNRRIAMDLGIPHVACLSHKLNNELNFMVEKNEHLESIIDSVKDTMLQFKMKLTTRAMLRNLSPLCPVIDNKTRWAGKLLMLQRFLRLRDQMILIANKPGSRLRMNKGLEFRNSVQHYAKQLSEIHSVNLDLQTRAQSLADCRQALDVLLSNVAQAQNDENHPMYGCTLGSRYIGRNGVQARDRDFVNGVVKLQDGYANDLTDAEKVACSMMKISGTSEDGAVVSHEHSISHQIAARRKRKRESRHEAYINPRFVLGSVAEVERLWSLCNKVLGKDQHHMSPLMLETILFLKVNASYWGPSTVANAMTLRRSEHVDRRLAEIEEVDEETEASAIDADN